MNEEELKNAEIEAQKVKEFNKIIKLQAKKIKLLKEREELQEQLRNVYENKNKTR